MATRRPELTTLKPLEKAPTGIVGFDDVTGGGLPRGRPTLVCGTAGCGKTLFGIEFLVRGATQYDEPGVLVSFEETAAELTQNVASLGFDLADLCARKKLSVSHIHVERSEIEETGEYNLEGLFIRLEHSVNSIGAKRIVLDTIEALFAGIPNAGILRAEIRRLFRWLKDKGLTAVITGERGDGTLTRHGLEEYVSDCVILLDHRVSEERSTRRLRVVKYRGSLHGTNEYPFLIDESGMTVMPVTSLGLEHAISNERVSTGIPDIDGMLEGHGYYRGSTILVSGTAGCGKSAIAAQFAEAACNRGERCLYFAHEESPDQIARNMKSLGIGLAALDPALFKIHASRPSTFGLEMHLALAYKLVREFDPSVVVVDPITSLAAAGDELDVKLMLTRLIDFLKMRGITSLFTSLIDPGSVLERSEAGVSSLIDTWILVQASRTDGLRRRTLEILKSRGMAHSDELMPFHMTGSGLRLTTTQAH